MKYRVTQSVVYEVEAYDETEEGYGCPKTSGEAIDLVADQGYRHPAITELWTQWEVQQILPPDPRAG